MKILTAVLIFKIIILAACERKIASFWHISNVTLYAQELCGSSDLTNCTIPLLNTLMEHSVALRPDFILWTSAGGPHLAMVAEQFRARLKNVVIIPALAAERLPASNRALAYYEEIALHFGQCLDDSALSTFLKAGYYARSLAIPKNLRIVVLNTALFCEFHVASAQIDPAGQWKWLAKELMAARKNDRKVYLVMSAPPGVLNNMTDRLFAPHHNRRYIKMIRAYSDVIAGQFAGHKDGDLFRIFYDKNEHGCGWMLITPPLTPSLRLFLYDVQSLEPLDYVQFHRSNSSWHTLYRFAYYYFLPNISVFALELLVTRMQQNNAVFRKYLNANSDQVETGLEHPCDSFDCTKRRLCEAIAIDYSAYIECIAQNRMKENYKPRYFFRRNRGPTFRSSSIIVIILAQLFI